MTSLYRTYKFLYPTAVPKASTPLRFGILGAANIAPIALINPATSHAEVVILAVGARDKKKAEAFAKKNKIERAYQGYDAVINDPDIDAIYIPLPNGLHYEWTMRALAAGKHVLLEKPACNTEDETKRLFAFAKEKGLILLEAFHYRFHPAFLRFKQIVDSGEIGAIKSVSAHLAVPRGFIPDDDIRFKYNLGGGAATDMGCYVTSASRTLVGSEPVSVISAVPAIHNASTEPKIDRSMTFTFEFPSSVTADCFCDLGMPAWGPFSLLPRFPDIVLKVVGEEGEAEYFNFPAPVVYHYITVKGKNGKRTDQGYPRKGDARYAEWGGDKGEAWWSTYRFQLEAFVDMCKGRTPQTWVSPEDSLAQARAIDMVYEKSGLGLRPNSDFTL